MRIKVTKSSNARALCNYALEPSKQKNKDANPVVATNMAGGDEFTLAQEFELIVNRPRRWPVERTMAHYSISLPPREELKPTTIADISKELLHQLGHAHCPYFVVQHHDQEHKRGVHHWHIVTSTITYDGRWVDDSFNTLKLKPIEREIEDRFGLTPSPTRSAAERQNLTTGEHRRKERTGEVLPKEKLWIAIDSATQDRPTLPLMLTRLKAQGIDVHLWRKGDSYSGISFALDGTAFAGRRLGPAYSLGGLQKHKGLYYDVETHNAAIEQILNETSAGCRKILTDHTTAQNKLKQLYQQYSKGMNYPDETLDKIVAAAAIADGYSEHETINILRQGAHAKQLRDNRGPSIEIYYCRSVVEQTKQLRNDNASPKTQHNWQQVEL